jgi:hypothetical protein
MLEGLFMEYILTAFNTGKYCQGSTNNVFIHGCPYSRGLIDSMSVPYFSDSRGAIN